MITIDHSSSTGIRKRQCVPIYFDSSNIWHRDIQYHPEQPERISVCVEAILRESQKKKKGMEESFWNALQLIDVADTPHLVTIPTTTTTTLTTTTRDGQTSDNRCSPPPSTLTSIIQQHEPITADEAHRAKDALRIAHTDELVTVLENLCRDAKNRRVQEGKSPLGHLGNMDHDTYITTESFDVCVRAMAAWTRATDRRRYGRIAMALTRPPGHHATKTLPNGFCLFNFAAATAIQYLASHPQNDDDSSAKKVSILDWDVHYGQGVADIVAQANPYYADRIRYVSIHQVPAFPYEGESFGTMPNHPNIMTIPIRPGTSWATGYQQAFTKALQFVATPSLHNSNQQEVQQEDQQDQWVPDLLIVCAGYDALAEDELASVCLSASDYYTMTRSLLQHLDQASVTKTTTTTKKTQVVFGLEGGYQLNNVARSGNLPDAVLETLRAAVEYEHSDQTSPSTLKQ